MDVLELKKEIATHIQDPAMAMVNTGQLLIFINSAARDLRNSGWYLPNEEDESLSQASNTYVYSPIPTAFVNISSLRRSADVNGTTVFSDEIPMHQWELGYDSGIPIIRFDDSLWSPDSGRAIKIIGQKRPTIYTTDEDTVDLGTESFLRERGISKAARMLAPGSSERARYYGAMSEMAMRDSERLLMMQPQAFRQDVDARQVPGR